MAELDRAQRAELERWLALNGYTSVIDWMADSVYTFLEEGWYYLDDEWVRSPHDPEEEAFWAMEASNEAHWPEGEGE